MQTSLGEPKEAVTIICERCKNIFITKKGIRLHMQAMHGEAIEDKNKAQKYICKECGKTLTFKCDQCRKIFEIRMGIRLHMKSMHGELKEGKNDAQDFLCENCGELFMDKKIIKEHGIIVD